MNRLAVEWRRWRCFLSFLMQAEADRVAKSAQAGSGGHVSADIFISCFVGQLPVKAILPNPVAERGPQRLRHRHTNSTK